MILFSTKRSRYAVAVTLVVAAAATSAAIASTTGSTTRGIHVRHFASSRTAALARWQRAAVGNPDPGTIANLRARALTAAAANGDSQASIATVVATLHSKAMTVDSNSSPASDEAPSQQVYYILVRGHFTSYGAPHPYGTAAPTGIAMSLTIDAVTGELTDFSIFKAAPDVASLGTPITVALK